MSRSCFWRRGGRECLREKIKHLTKYMKRLLTVLFLIGHSAQAAVFDLEALMAMT